MSKKRYLKVDVEYADFDEEEDEILKLPKKTKCPKCGSKDIDILFLYSLVRWNIRSASVEQIMVTPTPESDCFSCNECYETWPTGIITKRAQMIRNLLCERYG